MGKTKARKIIFNGKALLGWRDRMGFSQRDACEALGCSRGALGGWENGTQKPIPRYIGLACAALALGMEPYGISAKK